jgi:hypothetical protein
MNNLFSASRFLKLFNKHSKEQYKTYLMSTAVLIGLLSVGMGGIAYGNDGAFGPMLQFSFFFAFFLLTGTVFTSIVFADLGDTKKAIPALTLPVSHFERFLVGWLYSFVIFQLVYFSCFYIVDLLVINIGNNNPRVHNTMMILDFHETKVCITYLAFILLHSIAFLGAIFFEKLHFIKTGFVLFIFLIALILTNNAIVHLLFNKTVHPTAPFQAVYVQENTLYYQLKETETGQTILVVMIFSVTLILWVTAYFKLKEKQV